MSKRFWPIATWGKPKLGIWSASRCPFTVSFHGPGATAKAWLRQQHRHCAIHFFCCPVGWQVGDHSGNAAGCWRWLEWGVRCQLCCLYGNDYCYYMLLLSRLLLKFCSMAIYCYCHFYPYHYYWLYLIIAIIASAILTINIGYCFCHCCNYRCCYPCYYYWLLLPMAIATIVPTATIAINCCYCHYCYDYFFLTTTFDYCYIWPLPLLSILLLFVIAIYGYCYYHPYYYEWFLLHIAIAVATVAIDYCCC